MKITVKYMLAGLSGWILLMFLLMGATGTLGFARLHDAVGDITATAAAVRRQMDADMMHDAIRSDVLAALLAARDEPQASAEIRADLEGHVVRLRRNIDENLAAGLGPEVVAFATQTRAVVGRYVASALAIVAAAGDGAVVAAQMEAFDLLLGHLQQIVRDARARGEAIRQSGRDLLSTAGATVDNSQQQSDAADAMAATVEQLATSIRQMSEQAQEVATLSGRSGALSAEGARVTEESAGAIEVIAGSVQASASAPGPCPTKPSACAISSPAFAFEARVGANGSICGIVLPLS